jgi:thiol-disulfide isomerase/thioredoxin
MRDLHGGVLTWKVGHMKAILLVCILLLAEVPVTVSANTPGEVEAGGYLREATLNGFSGKSRKFSDYRGKPLIINVWASWCSPCRAEMGSLEQLSRRFGGRQFNIIGISTDDDGYAAAAFIKQSKITFENYLDSKVFLENMLGANTIPLTVLVDANGRVLLKVRGNHKWDSPEYLDLIGKTFGIKL